MQRLTGLIDHLLHTFIPDRFLKKLDDQIAHGLIETLLFFRIATLATDIDRTKIANRACIFLEEARRRGLDVRAIKIAGRYTNSYRFFHHDKTYDYHEIPLTLLSEDISRYDPKASLKAFLQQQEFPHAPGICVRTRERGLAYAKTLGFPLVVKPNDGTLSAHATYPINDEQTLVEAIQIAQRFQSEYIIERFVEGNLYRATVIGQTHVFVCQREAANVIGDGSSTIEQLIEKKNADPRRAPADIKHSTLHTITIDERLLRYLTSKQLTLNTVPAHHQKIVLSNKAILSAGCDVIACTSHVHPENRALFLRLAQLLNTDLIGIDFIAPDISLSHTQQTTAILEINTLPYVDMHQNPSDGEPDPIARVAWDVVLEKMKR